jgi:hypothetical protein
MSIFRKDPAERGTSLLRSLMPEAFKVIYIPDFPRLVGGTGHWFQVVFAVGPGDDAAVRAEVHSLFERMLHILSDLSAVREADQVSLRARRRVPESATCRPEHPLMFIEASWAGATIEALRERQDFSSWARELSEYSNWFDQNDPLTRSYERQPII